MGFGRFSSKHAVGISAAESWLSRRIGIAQRFAVAGALALFWCLQVATGQGAGQAVPPPDAVPGADGSQTLPGLSVRTTVIPLHGASDEEVKAATAASLTIPSWSYTSTSSRDVGSYTITMVGASPFTSPDTSTSVPTQIIPIIFHMADGGVFDPTVAPPPCAVPPFTTTTQLAVFQQSPIFQNYPFIMNGVSVGSTQYVDAFQRANFWSLVGGHNYHVLLSPTTLTAVTLNVPADKGGTISLNNGCGNEGLVDLSWLQTYVEGTLIPSLGGQGVTSTSFPLVLLADVINMAAPYVPGTTQNRVAGYHSAFGNPVQTYAIGPAGVMSHEIPEWMDDPFGTNQVPAWGNIGQVTGRSTTILEVSDPFPGFFPPVIMPNGYTYTLLGAAFFSWFLGSPSLGAGGKFSNDGSFVGQAALFPPGGTNPAPPAVTSQPASQTIASGATATMSIVASGTGGAFTYRWYLGSSGTAVSPIDGASSNSYTTPALTTTTSYWVRVQDANGTAFSNTATITVASPTIRRRAVRRQ